MSKEMEDLAVMQTKALLTVREEQMVLLSKLDTLVEHLKNIARGEESGEYYTDYRAIQALKKIGIVYDAEKDKTEPFDIKKSRF